ncbi:N-acetylmuramoyl-L-alanine amidase [Desmospora activa]|uniref:N-acetylmuramoyl-L-alanine amidase n=1 Tax=Desmospora activa DSM 45169 TaxID=1121389 RepID=A0A2T4ZAY7_9BACL|nr:N-acetylmuramoyl-L-alanine amidase [Desmospora activa]PTM59040.1 N-acetylmuramoyl-L-alanine amidase [Desmospora activa DSM 45169]
MAKIAVDPGHGTNTPGKRTPTAVPEYGRVVKEYEFNKPAAQFLKKALERNGHSVVWTGGDEDPSLSTRCQRANNANVDLFISIHYNAGGGYGVETYIVARGGQAEKLANRVQPELVKVRDQRDRGVKVANFQVLRDTKMPAILCECGFMDDPRGIEQAWMLDEDFQRGVGEAICKGVQRYYGAPYKEPQPEWSEEELNKLNSAPNGARFSRTLKRGMKNGKDIAAVQTYLGGLKVDEDFGPLTESALKEWQQKNGIKVTGEVGIANWRYMFGEKPTWKPEDIENLNEAPNGAKFTRDLRRVIQSGKDVEAVQTKLNIVVDGWFGPKTEAGVKAYQQKAGLVVDGWVGPKTWADMFGTKQASAEKEDVEEAVTSSDE